MKSWLKKLSYAVFVLAMSLPMSVSAQEKKSFWAKLVPDNSTALDFVDNSKTFFGQLFEDTKQTGKALIDGGKDVISDTGDTIKSLTSGD